MKYYLKNIFNLSDNTSYFNEIHILTKPKSSDQNDQKYYINDIMIPTLFGIVHYTYCFNIKNNLFILIQFNLYQNIPFSI